jgi:hypothetical protein
VETHRKQITPTHPWINFAPLKTGTHPQPLHQQGDHQDQYLLQSETPTRQTAQPLGHQDQNLLPRLGKTCCDMTAGQQGDNHNHDQSISVERHRGARSSVEDKHIVFHLMGSDQKQQIDHEFGDSLKLVILIYISN